MNAELEESSFIIYHYPVFILIFFFLFVCFICLLHFCGTLNACKHHTPVYTHSRITYIIYCINLYIQPLVSRLFSHLASRRKLDVTLRSRYNDILITIWLSSSHSQNIYLCVHHIYFHIYMSVYMGTNYKWD